MMTGKRAQNLRVAQTDILTNFAFALGDYRFLHCVKQFGLLQEGTLPHKRKRT